MANRYFNNNKVDGESYDAADVEAIETGFQVVENEIDAHTADTANPHSVTKSQVGLGNVDNTSDANKPVSTAQQTALNGKKDDFVENAAFNKNFGSAAGTVCQGNDSRLSDTRDPNAHSHAISDTTGLQTALDGKSANGHGHSISDTTGLQTALDGKEAADPDILKADTTDELSVGFTTTAETLASDTITPDFTAQHVKTRTCAGNVTINAASAIGECKVKFDPNGADRTVTAGANVTILDGFTDMLTGGEYHAYIYSLDGTSTVVKFVEIV